MMLFFNVVYEDRKCDAEIDPERGFYLSSVGSLDAPAFTPAGSTRSHEFFFATSITYRR
jgi:hypothetical protein